MQNFREFSCTYCLDVKIVLKIFLVILVLFTKFVNADVINIDNKELSNLIVSVLEENECMVKDYKSGKDRLFGFFVGQVMKASQGKANPKQVNDILKSKLEK